MTTTRDQIKRALKEYGVPLNSNLIDDLLRIAEDREIFGLAETAAYLGVPKPRVINWGNHNTRDYPTPFLRLGCGSHQPADTIRAWAKAHARHLGPTAGAWADLPASLREALQPSDVADQKD
jgi:hypothetical protein